MAIDRITVDPAKTVGAEVRQLGKLLDDARALAAKLVGEFSHMVAAPDYTDVAEETGLQNVDGTDGDGETLYNLVLGVANTDLQASNIVQFVQRIGYR
ncbi:MAG: hypothetical protein GY938_16655 [Ketobacter sp.]|nr:hypothetical protein [Ketobacter sp.]